MMTVYEYLDYRCFLKDKINELRQTKAHFSYRNFNRVAGISSSGFLKLVIDGKRNLGIDGIRKIIRGLGLKDDEASYFETLVKFNQADTHKEKDYYFKKISQNRCFLKVKYLTALQYQLFSNWYYVAILELVRLQTKEKKDVKWLEKMILPRVSVKDIKKAIKELGQMGVLIENEKGNLERCENLISTPEEVGSVSVINFHSQMSELAAKAVKEQKAKDREFSSLTIALSEDGFKKVKKEIQKFRKKLHLILEESNGEKKLVSHINLQAFLLSQKEE